MEFSFCVNRRSSVRVEVWPCCQLCGFARRPHVSKPCPRPSCPSWAPLPSPPQHREEPPLDLFRLCDVGKESRGGWAAPHSGAQFCGGRAPRGPEAPRTQWWRSWWRPASTNPGYPSNSVGQSWGVRSGGLELKAPNSPVAWLESQFHRLLSWTPGTLLRPSASVSPPERPKASASVGRHEKSWMWDPSGELGSVPRILPAQGPNTGLWAGQASGKEGCGHCSVHTAASADPLPTNK